jgi:hypothetical protein
MEIKATLAHMKGISCSITQGHVPIGMVMRAVFDPLAQLAMLVTMYHFISRD